MIRHVLLDADGVLQYVPGGWVEAMRPYLGDRVEAFLEETWTEELPRGKYGPGTGWVVLADPEGNEFCILRSQAERAGT